jgi:hypothetical protein
MARRISRLLVRSLAPLVFSVLGAACHPGYSPELHVLGVQGKPVGDVLFVEVTNPAKHAMRLTKLDYTLAAGGKSVGSGQLSLAREVPAGAAVVVEIPLDQSPATPLTMSGTLTTELDQIVQQVPVTAQIRPASASQP